ncbi:MAG: ribosome silencing factor [Rhodothermales bacterium]
MTANQKVLPTDTPLKSRANYLPVNELAQFAVEAILSKKGTDIVVMDMRAVSGVADIFIICSGSSELQIKAIAEAVRMEIKENASELPWHSEGLTTLQWVLLDYVDLVVHIFNEEKRTFYDLERLWGDAPKEDVAEDTIVESIAILQSGESDK